MSQTVIFREKQRFTQVWVWIVVLLAPAAAWWAFIARVIYQEPAGPNQGPDWLIWLIWLVIGIGMPVLLGSIRLITQVDSSGLRVSFAPFHSRLIQMSEIRSAEAIEYHPIRDFGGWGIRWVPGGGMVYNVSGNRGVRMELGNGKWLIVGSQKAAELAAIVGRSLSEPIG